MHTLKLIPVLLAALLTRALAQEPLVVCATTPNLGALVRAVTADDAAEMVELHVFCKPSQDPHFLRALPSFVRQLNQADLLIAVGLDLEEAWVPALLDHARNPDVRPGALGFLDASQAIRPLGAPTTAIDRAAGDVHFRGNPHYLVDPVSGALVADAIAKRLGDLRPAWRERLEENAAALRERLGGIVVGAELAAVYDFTKLVRLYRADKLESFLEAQGDLDKLGGALKKFARDHGAKVLADHDAWRYLTTTLGLETTGFLEPRPGIAPSTSHLRDLVMRANAERPRALLHVSYFEPRAIEFVADRTGVPRVLLAHQVGALPDTGDYVAMIRANLDALLRGLEASRGSGG